LPFRGIPPASMFFPRKWNQTADFRICGPGPPGFCKYPIYGPPHPPQLGFGLAGGQKTPGGPFQGGFLAPDPSFFKLAPPWGLPWRSPRGFLPKPAKKKMKCPGRNDPNLRAARALGEKPLPILSEKFRPPWGCGAGPGNPPPPARGTKNGSGSPKNQKMSRSAASKLGFCRENKGRCKKKPAPSPTPESLFWPNSTSPALPSTKDRKKWLPPTFQSHCSLPSSMGPESNFRGWGGPTGARKSVFPPKETPKRRPPASEWKADPAVFFFFVFPPATLSFPTVLAVARPKNKAFFPVFPHKHQQKRRGPLALF